MPIRVTHAYVVPVLIQMSLRQANFVEKSIAVLNIRIIKYRMDAFQFIIVQIDAAQLIGDVVSIICLL